jgi:hypothetical protein
MNSTRFTPIPPYTNKRPIARALLTTGELPSPSPSPFRPCATP